MTDGEMLDAALAGKCVRVRETSPDSVPWRYNKHTANWEWFHGGYWHESEREPYWGVNTGEVCDDPTKPQPRVFRTLADFVAYAEHPDRFGKVSGVDADGDEIGVFKGLYSDHVGIKISQEDSDFPAVALPITALDDGTW